MMLFLSHFYISFPRQHRICKYKRFIELCPNPFYNNIIDSNNQVLFRLRRSDILLEYLVADEIFSKRVLLKPNGFSVILFASNCRRQYHSALAEYNCEAIPLAKCNAANKTARLPYGKSR